MEHFLFPHSQLMKGTKGRTKGNVFAKDRELLQSSILETSEIEPTS